MSTTSMLRAALPALPGLNLVPGIRKASPSDYSGLTLSRPGLQLDPAHVAAYAEVCGFPRKDTLPVTYPHMRAFELHMKAMTDPAFPWTALGLVHVENVISARRPLGVDEILDLNVSIGQPRPHRAGLILDFVTEVSVDGELVWDSVSSYLSRGKGDADAPRGLAMPPVPVGTTEWSLPTDLGRRYGAVSGDLNPIHLYPVTAKAFGFPRHIAHGMWTKARCLAAIENRLPDAVRIEVAFKKPVFLPSKVAFGLDQSEDGWTFGLTNPKDGSPHLVGRTSPLDA